MASDEIGAQVKQILGAVMDCDPALIDADTNWKTVEKWDSLRHMNLVLALEDEFGIEFDDAEIKAITSYRAICETLASKL